MQPHNYVPKFSDIFSIYFSIYSSNQGKSFTVTYRFDIFRHDIRRSSECLTVKKVDRESLFNQVHAPIGAWKVKLEIMID